MRREESEKFSLFLAVLVCLIAAKIFGKIILKPLLIRKDSSSPRMTEQIQIYSGENHRRVPLAQSLTLSLEKQAGVLKSLL